MNENILIIDSDKLMLKKLRELLTKEGFSIMTVTNKTEALNLCKQLPIRLVIGSPYELDLCKNSQDQNT